MCNSGRHYRILRRLILTRNRIIRIKMVRLEGTCIDLRVQPPDYLRANQKLKNTDENIVQITP